MHLTFCNRKSYFEFTFCWVKITVYCTSMQIRTGGPNCYVSLKALRSFGCKCKLSSHDVIPPCRVLHTVPGLAQRLINPSIDTSFCKNIYNSYEFLCILMFLLASFSLLDKWPCKYLIHELKFKLSLHVWHVNPLLWSTSQNTTNKL